MGAKVEYDKDERVEINHSPLENRRVESKLALMSKHLLPRELLC